MLTGFQKAKALKELKQLRQDKVSQNGLALAKTLKRMKELRTDLGMGTANTEQSTDTSTTEPVIALTGKEFGEFDLSSNDGISALRDNVKDYLIGLRGQTVYCKALNADVEIRKQGIKKFMSFTSNPIKLQAAHAILDIIKNGKEFKPSEASYADKESNHGVKYHYLKTAFKVNDLEYGARIVVREDNDGNFHYDLQIRSNINMILDGLGQEKSLNVPNFHKALAVLGFNDIVTNSNSESQEKDINELFDKATIDANDVVLNLFIFDENGVEIGDESTGATDEPTELESLLKDLQEQHIQPDDIDLDHLADIAANSSEDETLDQIRNILDMELVAKWLQQLDDMAA